MVKVALLVGSLLLVLSGCSGLTELRDPRFTRGCAVVNADLKLGAMNQQGMAEACKLVYSEGYTYEYEGRGCKVRIGGK